ncbi:MAG: fumarylacetoacetate hydrolase family protein [Pseudomonadota bacterium]
MRLVSYSHLGEPRFGALQEDPQGGAPRGGIVDLTGRIAPQIRSIQDLLRADQLAAAADYVQGRAANIGWCDAPLLPVIPAPGKILCVGLNYETHRAETKRPEVANPTIFTRFADSQVAHRQPMVKPAVSERFDYEGELALVIGRPGRRIPEARALEHVAGYACYNDGSVRDWQRHTMQFTPGKTFPGTGAFGPYLLTRDAAPDYRLLSIETRLNGETMQSASLANLIFPLERLIAYISSFTPLSAGDVIVTGTPGGVGDKREPPVYLTPGDQVEVEIGPLGVLSNPVIAEEAI